MLFYMCARMHPYPHTLTHAPLLSLLCPRPAGSFEEAVTYHKQAIKEFVNSSQVSAEHLANIRDNLGFAQVCSAVLEVYTLDYAHTCPPHTHTHTHARTHARMHARTHAHTQTHT